MPACVPLSLMRRTTANGMKPLPVGGVSAAASQAAGVTWRKGYLSAEGDGAGLAFSADALGPRRVALAA